MNEATTKIQTASDLIDHIKSLVDQATITVENVERNDDDDLGGWLNASAELDPGTIIPVGWWLYAGLPETARGLSADLHDELSRDSWAIRSYSVRDMEQGDVRISDQLQALYDRVSDYDGDVEIDGEYVGSAADLVLHIVHHHGLGDTEVIEAWERDLRARLAGLAERATVGDLVRMVQAGE